LRARVSLQLRLRVAPFATVGQISAARQRVRIRIPVPASAHACTCARAHSAHAYARAHSAYAHARAHSASAYARAHRAYARAHAHNAYAYAQKKKDPKAIWDEEEVDESKLLSKVKKTGELECVCIERETERVYRVGYGERDREN